MDDNTPEETFDFMADCSRDLFHGVEIALVLAAVILAASFLKCGLYVATTVLSLHWGMRLFDLRGPLLTFAAYATLGTVVGFGLIAAASRLANAAYVQLLKDLVVTIDACIAARRRTSRKLARAGCGPDSIELPHCWAIFSKMGAYEDAAFEAALKTSGRSAR